MATTAVAAAPEAISEESSKTQIADRLTETQAVDDTRHADNSIVGNAPSVAGESQQDAGYISPASPDNIGSQAELAAPTPSAPEPPAANKLEALESNASGSLFVVPNTASPATPLRAANTETTTESQTIAATNRTSEVLQRSEMSTEHQQFLSAVAMNDDQLGKVIQEPTKRINEWVGNYLASSFILRLFRPFCQDRSGNGLRTCRS
jgi:hypothetical protein